MRQAGRHVLEYTEADGVLTFMVRVAARASKSMIAGEHAGALRVRVSAPPVEGAANAEVMRLLARELKVPVRAVEIASGHASKTKRVRVYGADVALLLNLAAEKLKSE